MDALPNHDCPLCGQPNGCAAAASGTCDTPCWCAELTFPAQLIERVPAPLRRVVCICRACVEDAISSSARAQPRA